MEAGTTVENWHVVEGARKMASLRASRARSPHYSWRGGKATKPPSMSWSPSCTPSFIASPSGASRASRSDPAGHGARQRSVSAFGRRPAGELAEPRALSRDVRAVDAADPGRRRQVETLSKARRRRDQGDAR